MGNQLSVIGAGSGTADYLLPIAKQALKQADFVISAPRLAQLCRENNWISMGKLSELPVIIQNLLQRGSVAVLVSGDPLVYSLFKFLQHTISGYPIQIIPGIGSLQILCAAFGLTLEEAAILSIHGRDLCTGKIAATVSQHPVTCFFCSKEQGAAEIAAALLEYKLSDVTLYIGTNLTYPDAVLTFGSPDKLLTYPNAELMVVAVKNPRPITLSPTALLRDTAFHRSTVPMTKEEIRAVALCHLQLQPDDIVWDIGAGTGSVSIECARHCPYGTVYALEKNSNALEILTQNQAYFHLHNMHVVPGDAVETMLQLPSPQAVFIGGNGKRLAAIVQYLKSLPQNIRIVMTAVTLETQNEAFALLCDFPHFEWIQMQVNRGKYVGQYHTLDGGHPVFILSCHTKELS